MAFRCRKKLCVIFFFLKVRMERKKTQKSLSLPFCDPHSQLRHYCQEELASSTSWASMVCFSVMQQVCFLFLTVFLMHQQRYRWFSPHCHSAVSCIWRSILWRRAWEEQTNQKGEMRRKCDWLACRGGGTNDICIPNKESGDERALLLRQHTCRGGILLWLHWNEGYRVLGQGRFEGGWAMRSHSFACMRACALIIYLCSWTCACENTASVRFSQKPPAPDDINQDWHVDTNHEVSF